MTFHILKSFHIKYVSLECNFAKFKNEMVTKNMMQTKQLKSEKDVLTNSQYDLQKYFYFAFFTLRTIKYKNNDDMAWQQA